MVSKSISTTSLLTFLLYIITHHHSKIIKPSRPTHLSLQTLLVKRLRLRQSVPFVLCYYGGVLVLTRHLVQEGALDAGNDVSEVLLETVALAGLALEESEVVDLFFLLDYVVFLSQKEVVVVVSDDLHERAEFECHGVDGDGELSEQLSRLNPIDILRIYIVWDVLSISIFWFASLKTYRGSFSV